MAYLVTGTAAEAEDAAQDGFVKAYLHIRRYRPGAPFRPWLLKIIGNEARNRKRSEGRRAIYETRVGSHRDAATPPVDPEAAAERFDMDRRLVDAVNRLPEKERLVIGLRYFLELSEEETAEAAGIPRGTVKSRVSRALGRLRSEIGELDV